MVFQGSDEEREYNPDHCISEEEEMSAEEESLAEDEDDLSDEGSNAAASVQVTKTVKKVTTKTTTRVTKSKTRKRKTKVRRKKRGTKKRRTRKSKTGRRKVSLEVKLLWYFHVFNVVEQFKILSFFRNRRLRHSCKKKLLLFIIF